MCSGVVLKKSNRTGRKVVKKLPILQNTFTLPYITLLNCNLLSHSVGMAVTLRLYSNYDYIFMNRTIERSLKI